VGGSPGPAWLCGRRTVAPAPLAPALPSVAPSWPGWSAWYTTPPQRDTSTSGPRSSSTKLSDIEPIIGQQWSDPTNHRTAHYLVHSRHQHRFRATLCPIAARLCSQSQERASQCKPIKAGDKSVSANHRGGRVNESQSKERTNRCHPITGGEGRISYLRRKKCRLQLHSRWIRHQPPQPQTTRQVSLHQCPRRRAS
jgi:hypothetical protein